MSVQQQSKLEGHLRGGAFQIGETKRRWRCVKLVSPIVFIQVWAGDGCSFTLRFDCTGYPEQPPTATLWDTVNDRQLAAELWPKGGRVSQVFNPAWKSGTALYLPCDRQSIEGHGNWFSEFPWLIWNPAKGIVQYVQAVSEVLQSNELIRQAA